MSVNGLREIAKVSPAIDASGEADYGHIDTFQIVGRSSYWLAGEFGHVHITSSEPTIAFAGE